MFSFSIRLDVAGGLHRLPEKNFFFVYIQGPIIGALFLCVYKTAFVSLFHKNGSVDLCNEMWQACSLFLLKSV